MIGGAECVIMGNDSSVLAGALTPYASKKWMRALEIARDNRIPYVSFVESAGADLRMGGGDGGGSEFTGGGRSRGQLTHFAETGRFFYEMIELSKMRIPTVCVVFGSSTAGGAYQPGLSDYNIVVADQSKIFLAGPPLVKMATGEESDDETLGGARLHAETSGLGDYFAADEMDAIRMCREAVSHLNRHKPHPGPTMAADEPVHDPEELLGLVSRDVRQPFDMREVIARVVGRFPIRGVQGSLRHNPPLRLVVDLRLPSRDPGQQRRALSRLGPEGRHLHPAVQPVRHPAGVPAEHHRLHGGPRL